MCELAALIKPTNKLIYVIEINVFPKVSIIFLLWYLQTHLKKQNHRQLMKVIRPLIKMVTSQ